MKYSIIIPTYNHCEDLLKPCLESIIKYTHLTDLEILISANGCKDNTKEYVESLGTPFKLLWNEEPLGFTNSVNVGLKIAQGEYIILLNNDIVLLEQPKNTWIDMLLTPFISNSNIGISGPVFQLNPVTNSPFVLFFCVMIKKEVRDKIGLLDARFTIGGCEDMDYCYRAQKIGYGLAEVPDKPREGEEQYVGGFPIYHKGSITVRNIELYSKNFENNLKLLEKKILENTFERAVFGKDDHIPPREHARYSWAKENILGTKILEIGCSSGYGFKYFKDIKDIVYKGIDKDKNVVNYAKKEFGDYFEEADVNDYEFENYDTIIAFEIIEHLDNGLEIVKKLQQHCKRLLITVPYNETPGFWGIHHRLHNLTEKHFPGFDFIYLDFEGNTIDKPNNFEGGNLLLLKKDN